MKAGIKIDLSSCSKRFAENNREFSICKKINFIFGKNGTGKTTITDAIKTQFSDAYNVCVFKDFEEVVGENDRLNAVALGTENAKIQIKIEIVDKEINEIGKEVNESINDENLFTKAKKACDKSREQENKIDDFFAKSAQKIKNLSNPQIAKTSYYKNDFKDEIANARLLSDDEIKKHKETIKSEKKGNIVKINFPNFDLSAWLKSTNDILKSSVLQQQIIDELENNIDKQNFAKDGLRIHKHKQGEKCAFCGKEISENRWQLLSSYFNDEVKSLEDKINQNVKKIDDELYKVNTIEEIKKSDFYEKFTEQIINLNLQIKNTKNEHKIFLEKLKSALGTKLKNLFGKSVELELAIPTDFNEIENSYSEIIKQNNDFSQNLTNEREAAKNALRYHELQKALDAFKFDTEKANLEKLKILKDEVQEELTDKKEKLRQKIEERNELILQTKDENKIAKQINRLLKNTGFASFELELVNDADENQKGQYQIKGYDGNIRPITELSKGEKNIIAFLYFLFSLEKVSDAGKPKIVVLDDPMTSNDDTMQYLMIGEIQKFYRSIHSDNYFVLLTHNCHFYLNVRPNTATKYIIKKDATNVQEISFYEKYGNYCLLSDGKHTSIRNIEKGHQDFKTNYDLLWKEIKFLYEEDGATANLMLNPFRKICETYMKFNCIVPETFFKDNVGVKKLYDVNQHSVDDLEAEQNGKTKDEIKQILKELFQNNNASDHFNNYWR